MASYAVFVMSVAFLVFTGLQPSFQNETKQAEIDLRRGTKTAADAIAQINSILQYTPLKSLEKVTGVVGAFLGVFSLIFMKARKVGSPEMIYMREQFGIIKTKLDTISRDIDHIQNLITEETQKAAYIADEGKILTGYNQLQNFFNELENQTCSAGSNCERERLDLASRYLQYFDVYSSMQNIIRGAFGNTTVFSKPLLDHIKISSGCSIPKIQNFSNGVIRLAIKAQTVQMIHEMLTVSNYSITTTMHSWLQQMYALKKHTDALISDCLEHISDYIRKDVKNPKFQSDHKSNSAAANEMKEHLESKYFWLDWLVLSFDISPDTSDYMMPKKGHVFSYTGNLRNFYALYIDKGTYETVTYNNIIETLNYIIYRRRADDISQVFSVLNKSPTAHSFASACSTELEIQGIWKSVKSLTVLKDDKNFVATNNSNNDVSFLIQSFVYKSSKYTMVFILNSNEELNNNDCNLSCKNGGSCHRYPYSSHDYCNCTNFFYGRECELRSNTPLAKDLEAISQQIMKIPKVTDIYFEIRDVSNIIGSSLGRIERAISHLDTAIGNALAMLHEELSDNLAWIGTVTSYGDQIMSLQYFIKLFEEYKQAAVQSLRKDETALAEAVLGAHRYDGIRKWLHDFNNLINGTYGFTLAPEEPILIRYMSHYQTMACTDAYKNAIDNVWRQLMFLQHKGYMMWIQALHILNEPSEFVSKQYQVYTDSQSETLRNKSCTLIIPNSKHVNCSGGFYLSKGVTVSLTCNTNFYLIGNNKVTCYSHNSTCNACNCYSEGSATMQCEDQTGNCTCREHFYGNKCQNRDCVWSEWTQWSACSMTCDYGGVMTKRRHHAITKVGSGIDCIGPPEGTKPCFRGCCQDQFHCTTSKRCIPIQQVCDGRNNCGDDQDENNSTCCNVQYTSSKNTNGDPLSLTGLDLNCGTDMIREFQLEQNGNEIKYRYQCCKFSYSSYLLPEQGSSIETYASYTFYFLDQQNLDCSENGEGFINRFFLAEAPNRYWKYVYNCSKANLRVNTNFAASCRNAQTKATHRTDTYDVFDLKEQKVGCDKYEFLSAFHLETHDLNKNNIWYEFRCCKMIGPVTPIIPTTTTTTRRPCTIGELMMGLCH